MKDFFDNSEFCRLMDLEINNEINKKFFQLQFNDFPISIISKYLNGALQAGFHAETISQEIKALEIFKSFYSNFPYTEKTLVFGTLTPFHPEKKMIGTFDYDILKFISRYSKDVKLIIGNGKNPEKANLKIKIFKELFPKFEIIPMIITPQRFYSELRVLPKDEIIKVILKMSGEWRDYSGSLYELHRDGRRNLIGIILKNVVGRRFAWYVRDLRSDICLKVQFPSIPEKSKEGRSRRSCPYCDTPSKDTCPPNKFGLYKCPKCGNTFSEEDFKLK